MVVTDLRAHTLRHRQPCRKAFVSRHGPLAIAPGLQIELPLDRVHLRPESGLRHDRLAGGHIGVLPFRHPLRHITASRGADLSCVGSALRCLRGGSCGYHCPRILDERLPV